MMIRPILPCAVKKMWLTQKEQQKLNIYKTKIMKITLGPLKAEQEIKRRTNVQIEKETDGKSTVKLIKKARVKWLRHVWKAGTNNAVGTIMEW